MSIDRLGITLLSKFDIHEWEIMNRFGQSPSPEEGGAEVANAIRGSGAFRVFKATDCRPFAFTRMLAGDTWANQTAATINARITQHFVGIDVIVRNC